MPDYRVITVQPGVISADSPALFQDLGQHTGHDADAAVEAALAARGGIPASVERCVAIPSSNWNEREVGEVSQPRFKVKPVEKINPPWRPAPVQGQPQQADPPPGVGG